VFAPLSPRRNFQRIFTFFIARPGRTHRARSIESDTMYFQKQPASKSLSNGHHPSIVAPKQGPA